MRIRVDVDISKKEKKILLAAAAGLLAAILAIWGTASFANLANRNEGEDGPDYAAIFIPPAPGTLGEHIIGVWVAQEVHGMSHRWEFNLDGTVSYRSTAHESIAKLSGRGVEPTLYRYGVAGNTVTLLASDGKSTAWDNVNVSENALHNFGDGITFYRESTEEGQTSPLDEAASPVISDTADVPAGDRDELLTIDNINLREAPDADSQSLGIIPQGTTVLLLDYHDYNWFLVSHDGLRGYIKAEFLAEPGTLEAEIDDSATPKIMGAPKVAGVTAVQIYRNDIASAFPEDEAYRTHGFPKEFEVQIARVGVRVNCAGQRGLLIGQIENVDDKLIMLDVAEDADWASIYAFHMAEGSRAAGEYLEGSYLQINQPGFYLVTARYNNPYPTAHTSWAPANNSVVLHVTER